MKKLPELIIVGKKENYNIIKISLETQRKIDKLINKKISLTKKD